MPQYRYDQDYNYRRKFWQFMQTIWPPIYRMANDFFFGVLHFIGDTLSGLWRR